MNPNNCSNCSFFNPIGRCEAVLPPDDNLMAVKEVQFDTPACELFVEGGQS